MRLGSCQCTYLGFWYDSTSTIFTIFELLAISLIGAMGIIVNYKFRKKLKEEKRNRPMGRKGNVIEPLMSWYCVILMFGIPYTQLLHWQYANEVIPFHLIPDWMCTLLTTIERCIAFCVVYNSMFVALIRFVYIVHQQKANKWEFEQVGRTFQFASVLIPVGMEIVHLSTNSINLPLGKTTIEMGMAKIESCNDSMIDNNSTISLSSPYDQIVTPVLTSPVTQNIQLVTYYLYGTISAVVSLIIIEGFLYIKIFRCIKR